MTQKITPYLWFDNNAEEAMTFYVSVFRNSEVLSVSRFRLDGQEFMALNGGPQFTFTEAISFFINCETQEEVDYFWDKLSAGGEPGPCGWLKDQFGLSWQVIPSILGKLLQDEDRVKANRVTQAMLQMSKIDIAKLQEAYAQE